MKTTVLIMEPCASDSCVREVHCRVEKCPYRARLSQRIGVEQEHRARRLWIGVGSRRLAKAKHPQRDIVSRCESQILALREYGHFWEAFADSLNRAIRRRIINQHDAPR